MDSKQNNQLNQDIIAYQNYIETKEKIDDIIEKLSLENRRHLKSWLNTQQMRLFELEQYENNHK